MDDGLWTVFLVAGGCCYAQPEHWRTNTLSLGTLAAKKISEVVRATLHEFGDIRNIQVIAEYLPLQLFYR